MKHFHLKYLIMILLFPLTVVGQGKVNNSKKSKKTTTQKKTTSDESKEYLPIHRTCMFCDSYFRIPMSLSGVYTWCVGIGEVRSLRYYQDRMCNTISHQDCRINFLTSPGNFWFCSESCLNGYKSNRSNSY